MRLYRDIILHIIEAYLSRLLVRLIMLEATNLLP